MKAVSAPVVTVAILTYKNTLELAVCLRSVLQQAGGLPFEVLVIDNNKEPISLTEEFNRVQVIKSEKNNLASARNLAIRKASGQYLLFLDSDCSVDETWLVTAYNKILELQIHDDRVVAVGGGSYVPTGRGITQDLIHITYSVPILSLNSPQAYSGAEIMPVDHLPTMNVIFDLNLLKDMQFDHRFQFCAEDLDFGFQLNRAGLKMFYSPDFAVAHNISKNFFAWTQRIFNFGASQVPVILKNKKILVRHVLILFWTLFFVSSIAYDLRLGLAFIAAHLLFCTAASLSKTKFNRFSEMRSHHILLPFFLFATHATYALGFLFGPYKYLKLNKGS